MQMKLNDRLCFRHLVGKTDKRQQVCETCRLIDCVVSRVRKRYLQCIPDRKVHREQDQLLRVTASGTS